MALVKTVCLFLLINCLLYCVSVGFKLERDKFDLMLRKLAKIVGKCTSPMIDNTGVLRHSGSHNNWPIDLVSNITLINLKDSGTTENFEGFAYRSYRKSQLKMHAFIVFTFSTANFRHLISKLKKTVLWDPLAQYLILDDRTAVTGCENAFHFLNSSWIEDLLYSTYFCLDQKEGFTMYTYNPYAKWAPDSWQEVNPDKYTIRNHTWSLFKRRLIPGRTTCEDFNFDKTITIGGYPINAIALQTNIPSRIDENITRSRTVGGANGTLIREVLQKLNSTLNLTVIPNSTDWPTYDAKIKNGEYDILLNVRYIDKKFNVSMTYVHEVAGIGLMTQHPGFEMQYTRILTYMNITVMELVFLVFVITIFVLWMCTGEGFYRSFFESYRLLLGTSILRTPRRNPLRIYLTNVLLLFMMTNAVFQSSLSSLLTIPMHKPFIEREQDLTDNPDILIYVQSRHNNVITDETIVPQVRSIKGVDCTQYVRDSATAACAADHTFLIRQGAKENFHVTRQAWRNLYLAFIVRPHWPFHERVSSILTLLNHAGIIQFLREKSFLYIIHKWLSNEKEESSKRDFHVMKLSDLMFAFYILLFGLSLATLVFLFNKAKHCITR